ncbi:uncharacterized protein LOC126669002 isoform X2 [Mercurialis annua]|uniref:uncharacterized protein LOC126669002 isoform X2 n=1 Tax=Mercurialis annua TaxID=3986 RepID=UPI0021604199|nr:uncharacterized protein LOC126669002 isoform X2 [Mercurialis annua]
MAGCNRNEEPQVTSMFKKYEGLVPKKKPLISKQGAAVNQNSTVPIETLQPKLKRTPHQQLPPRRPACTTSSTHEC